MDFNKAIFWRVLLEKEHMLLLFLDSGEFCIKQYAKMTEEIFTFCKKNSGGGYGFNCSYYGLDNVVYKDLYLGTITLCAVRSSLRKKVKDEIAGTREKLLEYKNLIEALATMPDLLNQVELTLKAMEQHGTNSKN
jgi:hypothetical protein